MVSSCFTANPLSNREIDFPLAQPDRPEVGRRFRNSFARPCEVIRSRQRKQLRPYLGARRSSVEPQRLCFIPNLRFASRSASVVNRINRVRH